jgi:hypothetical protein
MTRSEVSVIRLAKDVGGLLDGPAGLRQASFIDRELMPARVDRVAQSLHTQVGELFCNRVQSLADMVELARHRDLRCALLAVPSNRTSP